MANLSFSAVLDQLAIKYNVNTSRLYHVTPTSDSENLAEHKLKNASNHSDSLKRFLSDFLPVISNPEDLPLSKLNKNFTHQKS